MFKTLENYSAILQRSYSIFYEKWSSDNANLELDGEVIKDDLRKQMCTYMPVSFTHIAVTVYQYCSKHIINIELFHSYNNLKSKVSLKSPF